MINEYHVLYTPLFFFLTCDGLWGMNSIFDVTPDPGCEAPQKKGVRPPYLLHY